MQHRYIQVLDHQTKTSPPFAHTMEQTMASSTTAP
jgi:hypothetical protein